MPEAVCVDTGREVGYGSVPIEKSPITGGAVRPYRFHFRNEDYSPRQIHELFYGQPMWSSVGAAPSKSTSYPGTTWPITAPPWSMIRSTCLVLASSRWHTLAAG